MTCVRELCFFVSLFLTVIFGLIYRKVKTKIKTLINNKRSVITPKKGCRFFIDKYIDTSSVYEVLDPRLEIVLRQMLNVPPSVDPIIISVPVLIMSYVVMRQPGKEISIWGLNIFMNRMKNVIAKSLMGLGVGAALLGLSTGGVISLIAGLLAASIVYNIFQNIHNLDCDKLVSKLSIEQNLDGKPISYLEKPADKITRIFIKENEST